MPRLLASALLLAATLLAGCGTTVVNPVTGQSERTVMDERTELAEGKKAHGEVLKEYGVYPDPKLQAYVNGVGQKLAAQSHRAGITWTFTVLDSPEVNAFALPGGYVYITRGLLALAQNEAELASVLGHEMGHADLRHSTRQMTQMFGVQILLDVLAGDRDALKQVTGALVGLKFSRNHEIEADERSVHYLCPTDYDAAGGSGFFQKIQALGGGRQPEFLSTHPDPGNRIENFQNNKVTKACQGKELYAIEYKAMLAKLPK